MFKDRKVMAFVEKEMQEFAMGYMDVSPPNGSCKLPPGQTPRVWGIYKSGNNCFFASSLLQDTQRIADLLEKSNLNQLSTMQAMEMICCMSNSKLMTNHSWGYEEMYMDNLPQFRVLNGIEDYVSSYPNDDESVIFVHTPITFSFTSYVYKNRSDLGKHLDDLLVKPLASPIVTTAHIMSSIDFCAMIEALNETVVMTRGTASSPGFHINVTPTVSVKYEIRVKKVHVNNVGDNIELMSCKGICNSVRDGRMFDSDTEEEESDDNVITKLPPLAICKRKATKQPKKIKGDGKTMMMVAEEWETIEW